LASSVNSRPEDFEAALLSRGAVSSGVTPGPVVGACAKARLDTLVVHTHLAFSTKPGSSRRRRNSAHNSAVRGAEVHGFAGFVTIVNTRRDTERVSDALQSGSAFTTEASRAAGITSAFFSLLGQSRGAEAGRFDTFVIHADLTLLAQPGSNRRRRNSADISVRGAQDR